MNINGTDVPTLKKVFTCEGCKWIINAVIGSNKPYKCFHDENIINYNKGYQYMLGDVGSELITPEFCPYLVKKLRTEKLKEINEHRRTQEEITSNCS